MSILLALFLANLGNCCIPVSLPDDTDGFTTVSTTVTSTIPTTTLTTTTPPNCLTQCPAISSFTACSSVTLPSGYTCQAVSPSPTSTRTGTTCSFLLDCTSFGTFYNPWIQNSGGPPPQPTTPDQSVTFTCPDGGSKWTDSKFNTADNGAVCAARTPTCLMSCPTAASFTDCTDPTVTAALGYLNCYPPSPTPMSTRAGTTCLRLFVLEELR